MISKKLALFLLLFFAVFVSHASAQTKCGDRCGPGIGSCINSAGVRCSLKPGTGTGVCVPIGGTCTALNFNYQRCCVVPTKPSVPITGVVIDPSPAKDTIMTLAPTPPAGGTSTPVTPGAGLKGDCSGAGGVGLPDGKVDLFDVDLTRLELSKQVSTLHCDFDKNGMVDIIDVTDYLRLGLIGS